MSTSTASLEHIGERKLDDAKITVIEYDETRYLVREVKPAEIGECRAHGDTTVWINVDGAQDQSTIDALALKFSLHPVVVEDIVSVHTRPKLEEHSDCLFISLKMLAVDQQTIVVEQMSMVLGDHFVITFQERVGDVFEEVRTRLKNGTGRIRKNKADYLAYRLIDAIVDNYFVALDTMSDLVEQVETRMTDDAKQVDAHSLHTLKRETLYLRRAITPARELVSTLSKLDDVPFIRAGTLPYLRDVHEHLIQVTEGVEVIRGILASMTDVHLAAVSNQLNEVMKVMTIVSTIFIPLSFIAGVYGMNFDYMPELHWHYGYPAVLVVMFVSAAIMLAIFKRKKWF